MDDFIIRLTISDGDYMGPLYIQKVLLGAFTFDQKAKATIVHMRGSNTTFHVMDDPDDIARRLQKPKEPLATPPESIQSAPAEDRRILPNHELDKRLWDILQLATAIYENKPAKHIERSSAYRLGAATGLTAAILELNALSQAVPRFVSTCGMRLGAAVCLLEGQSREFVYTQWRGLLTKYHRGLSPSGLALLHRVQLIDLNMASFASKEIALAYGLWVFREANAALTECPVLTEKDVAAAVKHVQNYLIAAAGNRDLFSQTDQVAGATPATKKNGQGGTVVVRHL